TDQWATVARMQQPRYAPQLTVGAGSVFVPDANQPVLARLAP
ncbi:MAG: hypothetical protein JWM05_1922, partial [Acidimicrobiales bacterium]|nr:hypothetical protein [Acidimicrobiales bacterium]